jgi:16S rRNA (guanine1516-N2)-methyltransferase
MFNIALATSSPQHLNELRQLADQLQIPIVDATDSNYSYLLILTDEGLKLHSVKENFKDIFVNFIDPRNYLRYTKLNIRNELIARAAGIKANYKPKVLDATAGLGKDGFVLACLGCEVQLLERSAIMVALLQDGLKRAKEDAKFSKLHISLLHAEANDYMQRSEKNFDVVYIDPMFPERSKSALVKKEMRVLRELIGEDEDAATLLQSALKFARKRVVVKRPLHAASIDATKPDVIFKGKASRFDVYLR